MAKTLVFCPVCGFGVMKKNGAIARAAKVGMALYCSRECSGVAHRKGRSKAERVEAKRVYDAKYRAERAAELKARKAAYHKRTYDPTAAREVRAKRMPYHIEYCRQPKYVAWKREYDKQYRAKKLFGPFWESALLVNDINFEVLARASRYEIDLQNGKLNKATKRKRDYDQLVRS